MSRHKTVLSFLIPALLAAAVLLAPDALSQALEQIQVLVGEDRTAVIRIHPADGDSGLSGNVKASADLTGGRSAVRGDLQLIDAEELDGGMVDALLKMSGKSMEMIGKADLSVPDDAGDVPDELDVSIESVTARERSYAEAELTLVGPADEPGPTLVVDGTMEGSFEALSGTLDYSVTLSDQEASEIPVTELSLSLAEEASGTGESETVTTTQTLSLTAPKGTRLAQQLRMAAQSRALIEQRLRMLNLQVESLELPPVEETESAVSARATIAVRDLRGTLSQFIDRARPAMARDTSIDPRVMSASLETMLAPRLDTLAFTMSVDGTTVSGQLGGEISRLSDFFAAYMDFVRVLVEQSAAAREEGESGDPPPYLMAIGEANLELGARSLQIATESDMSFTGDGKLELSSADGERNVDAELTLDVDGYEDFAERARAAGLPAADTALITADLHLTENRRLDGQFYFYSNSGPQAYYKMLVTEALARVGDAEGASSIVEEATLEDAAFSLNLEGRDLNIRGYTRSTPLARASRTILAELVPGVEGTPDGAYLDVTFNADGTREGDVLIRATDFMPNRSAAEIREALDLPETAVVRMDASADELALPTVEQPDIQISGELAGIQTSAQELFASRRGEDGALPWLLIAGALLLVALVGVGWATRRGSAR